MQTVTGGIDTSKEHNLLTKLLNNCGNFILREAHFKQFQCLLHGSKQRLSCAFLENKIGIKQSA